MPISRRTLLGPGLAMGMFPAEVTFAAVATSAPAAALDLASPRDNLLALLKILASTEPRDIAINFAVGRVYACLAGRAPIPLFGTHSISVARGARRADGSFLLRQHIVGFRTGFESETVIDEMLNPVTGERVELPLTDYGTNDSEYRFDGTYALVKPVPVLLSAAGARPWTRAGDIVALSDDSIRTEPGPGQPKVDVVTRFALVQELSDPAVASAASWFSFSAVDPFRSWLRMKEPGFQLWHVNGRKVRSAAEMPGYFQRVAADRFPGLFELPAFQDRRVMSTPAVRDFSAASRT